MPQLGPTLTADLVDCKRIRLERDDYFVDKVTVYETNVGIEALKFNVGPLFETFGKPTADSTETVITFTEENQLVGLTGYESFSGIKGI